MYLSFFLLLLFNCNVRCNDCVVFNFENNGFDDFHSDSYLCSGLRTWNEGKYSNMEIDSPHRNSTTFIRPGTMLTCTVSPQFIIDPRGIFEIDIYMESTRASDLVAIMALESMEDGNDPVLGNYHVSPSLGSPTGWQTLRMPIMASRPVTGYLGLMGVVSSLNIIIIDSIRYIGPMINETLCPIYEEDTSTEPDEVMTTIEPTTVQETNATQTDPEIPTTQPASTTELWVTEETTRDITPDYTVSTTLSTIQEMTTELPTTYHVPDSTTDYTTLNYTDLGTTYESNYTESETTYDYNTLPYSTTVDVETSTIEETTTNLPQTTADADYTVTSESVTDVDTTQTDAFMTTTQSYSTTDDTETTTQIYDTTESYPETETSPEIIPEKRPAEVYIKAKNFWSFFQNNSSSVLRFKTGLAGKIVF